jgi:hypothetical protein
MNDILHKLHLDNLGISDIPTGVMIAVGVVIFLVALKTGKFLAKLLFFVIALGLVGTSVWWHFHRH